MPRFVDRLTDAAANRMMRRAEVTAVEQHGPFRVVELAGDRLLGVDWTPGDKVQLRIGATGFTMRTFTPTRWDRDAGATQLVAFVHGAAPGATWMADASAGAAVQIFGPRRSLDLSTVTAAPVFVGDETSVALRLAWATAHPDLVPVADVFEVGDDATVDAMAALGVVPTAVVPRETASPDEKAIVDAVLDATRRAPTAPLVLTGRGPAIVAVRRALKADGHEPTERRVKTYWEPGRVGLD